MRKSSFTLIELIVVIAIIAVLAAVIAPNAFKAIEKAKISQAIANLKSIKTASLALYADIGRWPGHSTCDITVDESFLFHKTFSNDPAYYPTCPIKDGDDAGSAWDGPYLESASATHPWGSQYVFEGQRNWSGAAAYDLILEMGDHCYPNPIAVSSRACGPNLAISTKIDQALDNGDLSDGNMRSETVTDPSRHDLGWILREDTWQ